MSALKWQGLRVSIHVMLIRGFSRKSFATNAANMILVLVCYMVTIYVQILDAHGGKSLRTMFAEKGFCVREGVPLQTPCREEALSTLDAQVRLSTVVLLQMCV